jgi:hypothetical protein
VLARYDKGGRLIADSCGGSIWIGYADAQSRFAWVLDDMAYPSPEPYDLLMLSSPVLIGPRVPELSPEDAFPVELRIDREGRVASFSFAFGLDRCTDCCAEKRAELRRNVPLWRFQAATLGEHPVAVRIRTLRRYSFQTTDDHLRSEQFQLKWQWEKFQQKPSQPLP